MGKRGFRKPMKSIRCPLCKYTDIKLLGKRSDLTKLTKDYSIYVEDLNIFDRKIYKCQVCGLQFIHPMYNEYDLNALYNQDGYQLFLKDNYPIDSYDSPDAKYKIQSWKKKYMDLGISSWRKEFTKKKKRNPRFLDVGCGKGQYLIVFHELGFEVTGIDLSHIHIDFIQQFLNYNVINTSLEDFNPHEKFDCILAAHVIEHVVNLHQFMGKITNLLESDGLLLIETPIIEDFGDYKQRYRDIYHSLFFDHFTLSLLADMYNMQYQNSINLIFEDDCFRVLMLSALKKYGEMNCEIISNNRIKNFRSAYNYLQNDLLEIAKARSPHMLLESLNILDEKLNILLAGSLFKRAWNYWRKHGFISTIKKTFNFIVNKLRR